MFRSVEESCSIMVVNLHSTAPLSNITLIVLLTHSGENSWSCLQLFKAPQALVRVSGQDSTKVQNHSPKSFTKTLFFFFFYIMVDLESLLFFCFFMFEIIWKFVFTTLTPAFYIHLKVCSEFLGHFFHYVVIKAFTLNAFSWII